MNLRSKLRLFVLTPQEQRTIGFIVLAVALGLLTKHYRRGKTPSPPNEIKQTATPAQLSPTPGRQH